MIFQRALMVVEGCRVSVGALVAARAAFTGCDGIGTVVSDTVS